MKGTSPLNIDSAIKKLKDRADGIYYLVDKRKEYHNTLQINNIPHPMPYEQNWFLLEYSTVNNDTTGILDSEQIEELKNHLNNALVENIDFNTVLSLRIHEYVFCKTFFPKIAKPEEI